MGVAVHLFFIICDVVGEDNSTDRSCIMMVSSTAGLGTGLSLSLSGDLKTVVVAELEGLSWCRSNCDRGTAVQRVLLRISIS